MGNYSVMKEMIKTIKKNKLSKNKLCVVLSLLAITTFASVAYARDISYNGSEQTVYVKPGEPTQITFPGKIEGGFKRKNSTIVLDKQDNYLVIFANGQLPLDGESILVHLQDKRTYSIRIQPATGAGQRDASINVIDPREPEVDTEIPADQRPDGLNTTNTEYAPPTVVNGLMREIILVSEFGKQKGIPGYRRSNKYSGETVLNDGAVEAKIDEIFMGSNYWAYVLDVENLLGTTQKINPSTFRLDGTRAVTAQRWELAPKAMTDEQRIANAHKSKVYVVTIAKRK
jgi:hypothetical protein